MTTQTTDHVYVALSDQALDLPQAIARVAHPGAGAVDVFLGVVRAHDAGREVTKLEYSAYRPMALREMTTIAAEIAAAYPGVRLAAFHRLGALEVGELAVICAASAPHRGEAFAATRRLIDEIKSRVPIWKRQHGPTGTEWVGWVDARCGHGHGHVHETHGHSDGHSHGPAHEAHGHADGHSHGPAHEVHGHAHGREHEVRGS